MSFVQKFFALTAAAGMCLLGTGANPAWAEALVDTVASAEPDNQAFASTVSTEEQLPADKLPDAVSDAIPDGATLVSKNLAVADSGETKDVKTGKTVTDPKLVGTESKPADPLAKTNGRSFIPVPMGLVKEQMDGKEPDSASKVGGDEAVRQSVFSGNMHSQPRRHAEPGRYMSYGQTLQDAAPSPARTVALQNNQYGAYWGMYNGTQAFFQADGGLFAQQAKGVIDVSEWQGDINWEAARNSGVEGAIIRIGYGWGNGFDNKALRNISECKRLGIPFGIYLYSYAYDSGTASSEGANVVDLLRRAGVGPGDLKYPVYYDLELWSWSGHRPPTNPAVYDGIVNSWWWQLQSAGYNKLSVYSYTHYLNTALNSGNIRSRTDWVASYGSRPGFNYPANERCWQYSDGGRINGIKGSVDLNACGLHDFAAELNVNDLPRVNLPDGEYYINSWLKDSSGIDIAGASAASGVPLHLYSYNNSGAQRFVFSKQSDGSYVITNVNSGKALDVSNAVAGNNATVWQYDCNGSTAQRWFIRDAGNSYYLQSALGNWVLDIEGASTADNARVALYQPNGTGAQRFTLASVTTIEANTWYRIRSSINTGLVLDVPGGSMESGTRIQIYPWNGTDAQLYTFKQVGNGIYEISNARSGNNLEIAGGQTQNAAPVQQYQLNGTQSQRWQVRNSGGGEFSFVGSLSNKAMDISGAQAVSGQQMQIYSQNGTAAQKWVLSNEPTVRQRLDQLAAQHRNDVKDGSYVIASGENNRYKVDVAGGTSDNNGKVQLYAGNGTRAQQWVVRHDSQGYLTIMNAGSGKLMDVAGANMSSGARVQQYQANGTYAQKWVAVRQSDGSSKLISALSSDLVLDLPGGAVANNNGLQLYMANGTQAQNWRFE
ncbi:1,4-beta-N-acetylmuramidase [Bifidobacterium actinocoloniiforme DSM 22766]|uniref:1,4-beta-N-acetylmuramidase n=1 Tax=Bifidobacterium actinocoloniiforme DSM 22766 TaxID=1437605 RepID=A0A086Z1Y6_9BIFI|nr:RICIN domain-containing protein [Bifidobacterium actinocoloniiforme]KFI40536.1 1,4-beta-N-acetylmuramidase [Bifidobacterium actinocoloniiforme DSM 22766]